MCKKLSYLVCFALVLALAGTNVVLGQTVWEGRITDDNDDVEQQGSGMYITSSDLEMMGDGNTQVGLRFTGVFVPSGATITNAYIEFHVDEVAGNIAAHLLIYGELSPNAPAFASASNNVSDRPSTTAVVAWSPEHWPTTGEKQQTVDISPVIEEIVGQAGWSSNNALVLIIIRDPDPANPSIGVRVARAGPGDDSALLHIEYTLGNAGSPDPASGEIDVSIDTGLSWTAGVFAAATNAHVVYFSESFDDVSAGVGGMTQTPTTYDPGRLNYGTTYYWRVDEKNGAPDFGTNQGAVWSFTTEPVGRPIDGANITATASGSTPGGFGPENTINGSGLNEDDGHSVDSADMWLSDLAPAGAWLQYDFDKVYKLNEMLVWNSNQEIENVFGVGIKEATIEYSIDGVDWATLAGTHQFAQAPVPNTADYKANTTVDFGGVTAKHVRINAISTWGGFLPQFSLSEVRFLYIPMRARTPSPAVGAADVAVNDPLGWRAGREAASHDVALSADEQAVIDGTAAVTTVASAEYSPDDLALSATYYWNVTEVNDAETPTTWPGDVWSFTTKDHVVVDDFESYNDIDDLTDPASNRIFEAWPDGFGIATNGALVGNDPPNPSYAERTIVRNGSQSMPTFYSNTGGASFSEVSHALAPAQNWTKHGVTTLVIYFHGAAGNTGQMYVKINGTKIAYNGNAADIGLEAWQAWNIDLASSGANLQSVSSLAIGIDGFSANGTLYFDDIGLYAVAPAPGASGG